MSPHVDRPHQQRQRRSGHAAGQQRERGRPDLLIDRTEIAEQPAREHQQGSPAQYLQNLQLQFLLRDERPADTETDQHMGYRRDGAQQALRIERESLAPVHVRLAEHGTIHHGDDIVRRQIEAVSRQQDQAVGSEQPRCDPRNRPPPRRHGDQGSRSVAERQPLQYAQYAHSIEVVRRARHALPQRNALLGKRLHREAEAREPADGQTDGENHRRADQYLAYGRAAAREVVLAQRQIGRNAHDEHEQRKDQIGRRQPVPRRMPQRSVYRPPAAGIVHENHAGDGHAPQHVERKQAAAAGRKVVFHKPNHSVLADCPDSVSGSARPVSPRRPGTISRHSPTNVNSALNINSS